MRLFKQTRTIAAVSRSTDASGNSIMSDFLLCTLCSALSRQCFSLVLRDQHLRGRDTASVRNRTVQIAAKGLTIHLFKLKSQRDSRLSSPTSYVYGDFESCR